MFSTLRLPIFQTVKHPFRFQAKSISNTITHIFSYPKDWSAKEPSSPINWSTIIDESTYKWLKRFKFFGDTSNSERIYKEANCNQIVAHLYPLADLDFALFLTKYATFILLWDDLKFEPFKDEQKISIEKLQVFENDMKALFCQYKPCKTNDLFTHCAYSLGQEMAKLFNKSTTNSHNFGLQIKLQWLNFMIQEILLARAYQTDKNFNLINGYEPDNLQSNKIISQHEIFIDKPKRIKINFDFLQKQRFVTGSVPWFCAYLIPFSCRQVESYDYKLWEQPRVRRLIWLIGKINGLCNDLLSVSKDYNDGWHFNLVLYLLRQNDANLTVDEAIEMCIKLRDDAIFEFDEILKKINEKPMLIGISSGDQAAGLLLVFNEWAKCLRYFGRGFDVWQVNAKRRFPTYNSIDSKNHFFKIIDKL